MTALVQEPTLGMRLRALGRRILMSEYLILYLCIALFAALYLIVPRIASPYNISSLLSNMWPLLVVAIGQTFVLIIAGIDLSQGAVISLTSVIGAAFIAQSANPIIFEKSPLWGVLLFENGALLHGSGPGHPGGHRRDAAGGRAHRRLQRRRGGLRTHPALHGHARDVDVLRRPRHPAGQVREHHRPAGCLRSHRRRVRHRRPVRVLLDRHGHGRGAGRRRASRAAAARCSGAGSTPSATTRVPPWSPACRSGRSSS